MAKKYSRKPIHVDPKIFQRVKEIVKKKGYTLGGFADRAFSSLLEDEEEQLKKEKENQQ